MSDKSGQREIDYKQLQEGWAGPDGSKMDETGWINEAFADLCAPPRSPTHTQPTTTDYSCIEQRATSIILKLHLYMAELGALVDQHIAQVCLFAPFASIAYISMETF